MNVWEIVSCFWNIIILKLYIIAKPQDAAYLTINYMYKQEEMDSSVYSFP